MKQKKVLYAVLTALTLIIIAGAVYLNSLFPIITGYAAKNLCSDVFISGRQPDDVEATDLDFSFIKFTRNSVDIENKSVTSRFLWGRSKAIYRDGFGATLVRDVPEDILRRAVYAVDTDPGYKPDSTLWPLGDIVPDTLPENSIKDGLTAITANLMDKGVYNGIPFAFMVLHNGLPVAEAYRTGFDKETRFLSWSMAKSFTNALVGILVKMGKINITDPADIEEWKQDERSRITVNDLLQMQSGLKWNEDYGSRSDVNLMLFAHGDMSKYAVSSPAEFPAGTKWYYSSGTANIISHLVRKKFDNDTSCYAFIQDQFFEKIGITDAVFEVDPSGDFVGSSYLYATARDYSRFGLLYLNDGVFNGERILPEGWVDYTRTTASGSGGSYGALFWLNRNKRYPSAPEDMFSCEGHDGQMIFILPSQDLVVTVLGFSHKPDNDLHFDSLLRDIIAVTAN
jgi:CubicO group peptidase (beta-lactamase class C family)